ncbi:YhjD/YihY/BrkB family envelope integrity protein [Halovenus marina]|uniref:YihY/virulence factor BrkB family protein n=1 Tax=Halovenus marina TaxID=3396621 RepID=UPI003F556606
MTSSIDHARTVIAHAKSAQLPFLAAAIAYYAFVSLVPLVIVAVAVTSALAGESMTQAVTTRIGQFLTPEGTALIEDALQGGAGRESATVLGVLVFGWSGLRLLRGLDVAFAQVYGVEMVKSLPEQIRDVLLTATAMTVAVAVTGLVTAAIPTNRLPFSGVVASLLLAVALAAVFFPLYYLLPDRPVSAREAVPGAVLVGLGWTGLGIGFGIYAAQATTLQVYGVLAGVLLLLLWFYFGGLFVLVGAFLNAELAGYTGDRQLQQASRRDANQRTMTAERPPDDESERADAEAPDESESTGASAESERESAGPERERQPRADAVTQEEIDELRRELDQFEEEIEQRTVHREELEGDLKQYVRRRVRRGHARGWGPYLVLLYGTAMTLGAFYYLGGGWAILAMFVIWLSTLGLYTLMVVVGLTSAALGLPGRVLDRLRNLR